ncbi:hypothetical protein F2Q69_00046298 [Brassica cretica]|uniref:Uncharacterized protein n=1 Tax=Brassica cretica TaxID=69181 RepID=A0A8S9PPD2_BRACR|nr:hypothetical protein F2Q69_00046298 [Brassica cretica]
MLTVVPEVHLPPATSASPRPEPKQRSPLNSRSVEHIAWERETAKRAKQKRDKEGKEKPPAPGEDTGRRGTLSDLGFCFVW